MGTRNLTIVQINGEYKVAQYGQWDGYPSGAGLDIFKFIKNRLLENKQLDIFKSNVNASKFINADEIKKLYEGLGIESKNGMIEWSEAQRFAKKYPQLDRDMGAEILEYILENGPQFLSNSITFAADSLFCEWGYIVNLDEECLEVYEGFNEQQLEKTEKFYYLEKENKGKNNYHPIKLKEKITFDEINVYSEEDFLNLFAKPDEEEET